MRKRSSTILNEVLKHIHNPTTKLFHSYSNEYYLPLYNADLEKYERDVMGTSFRQYIPTNVYPQSTEEQIKLLEAYSFGVLQKSPPETMMAYETFTNIIYPHDKFTSIEKELNMKLKLAKSALEEGFLTSNKQSVISYRMTLTGRSGDGKTFFLHRLADTNDDCIVLPLHAGSANTAFEKWIEKKLFKQGPTKGAELSNTIVKGCEEILVSYLVELEHMIDAKCGGLEILYRFNNGLTSKVFENVEINNADTTLGKMAKQIFQKTGKIVLFVLDEAHIFSNYFPEQVVRQGKSNGSLLTAVTRSAGILPVLCCSTMISSVNLEIDIPGQTQGYVSQHFLPTLFKPKQEESSLSNDISCNTPSMFMNQFFNILETDLQKQHIDNLLSSSSVRFCTMIMDEYFKLCICKKNKNETLSKQELLLQSVRNVFTKRMPNYENKIFCEPILTGQLRNALEFFWAGLIPDIVGKSFSLTTDDLLKVIRATLSNCTVDFDCNQKFGVADTLFVPYMNPEQAQTLHQHLLSIGCGSIDHATPTYYFSDPFFRYIIFRRGEYQVNLAKSFNDLVGKRKKKGLPLYYLDLMKGFYFERIVALLLVNIAASLQGQSITKIPLFKQFRGTWLDNYTLRAKSAEHDSRFASGLIGMDLSDLICTSLDQDGSCDLFVSLVPVQNDSSDFVTSPSLTSNTKIPCLIAVKLTNNPKVFDTTNPKAQKLNSREDFIELLKYSNHCEHRCLRIVFNYRYSPQHDTQFLNSRIQSEDNNSNNHLSAIFSLLDERVKSEIDLYLSDDIVKTLYKCLK